MEPYASRIRHATLLAAGLAAASPPSAIAGQSTARPVPWEIAAAVLALPEALRDGAEVRARAADGSLTTIREGTNGLICLGDVPDDGGFSVACYHGSLEPFMARGRELTREGVTGMDRQRRRWEEVRAGALSMPGEPATVYNLRLESEDFDPAEVDPTSVRRLHAVYVPFATPESTGLPTDPSFGGPWLMWPGEPSAHIMISVPPSGGR